MQDTKNLKRKVKEYKKLIVEFKEIFTEQGQHLLGYYENQLQWTEERVKTRERNRLKNVKQYKKAN